MASQTTLDAFLLTRHHKDLQAGLQLEFWAASPGGPVRILMPNQEAVFFARTDAIIKADRIANTGLLALDGTPLQTCYFQSQQSLHRERRQLAEQGVPLYESGIAPADRFLMERFITAPMAITGAAIQRDTFLEFVSPQLRPSEFRPCLTAASLDIETEGLDGALYSVAIATPDTGKVFTLLPFDLDDEDILRIVDGSCKQHLPDRYTDRLTSDPSKSRLSAPGGPQAIEPRFERFPNQVLDTRGVAGRELPAWCPSGAHLLENGVCT